ncbi:ankyrin repeat-containing domain protein [Mycena rebaudengoi]|nr:ankyrin repeat-containing domain protein [Mycena rebaudengoi]
MAETFGIVAASLQLVAVLKAAINVGLDVRNAPKEQQDLAREIGGLEPLLTQLQGRLRDNLSAGGIQQLTEPLTRTAGAGKTVLSSIAVDHLRTSFSGTNVGVACAYLNHKETEAQSPANILAGLWRQIIFQKPISADSLAHELYVKHREQRTWPSVDEVHTVLCSALEECPKAYIVIDALDEYPEQQRRILLKYLAALGPNINLMLTSWPHITPTTFFPSVQALEIRATEADIRRYIVEQIRASTRLSKHVQSRPELCQETKATIMMNADGMFLLAKLHTDSLTTKVTVKAVREALKNLPKDLEHTVKTERNIAYLALIWVANAKRPLSAAELQEAIAIERDSKSLDPDGILDITLIVSVCAGLLIIDAATGLVRLIHYTTQDYLNGIQDTKFPLAQTEIAQRCLTYVLFDTFQNLPDSEDGVEDLLKHHSLLLYACWNGLIHAAGDPEKTLQHLILEFCGQASKWEIFLNKEKGDCLVISSFYGYLNMVHLLIEQGADIHAQTKYHGNALQAVSSGGHEALVCLLIEMGADIHAEGGLYGNALQAASDGGHGSLVHLLIEKGADVNAQGGLYANALQAASAGGHESLVHLLIDQGADINAQGGHYGNALQAASHGGKESLVRLLIERGADINAQGGHYGNALQAAKCSSKESVVRLLIEKGADINVQGGHYENVLQAASFGRKQSLVHLVSRKCFWL